MLQIIHKRIFVRLCYILENYNIQTKCLGCFSYNQLCNKYYKKQEHKIGFSFQVPKSVLPAIWKASATNFHLFILDFQNLSSLNDCQSQSLKLETCSVAFLVDTEDQKTIIGRQVLLKK